ncbi:MULTISPECIES: FHA domain-containing protein [Clostridium]|uniref:FHA domain-containing protein n=1 Tax=Clostridium cibarium TaxID=2762247 RepID=A0ABR8PVY0_9CLOT|nr:MULTISPECIES: FHA domain-containing protein [Clostridium]MBD7912316.1 FHA domain-containing protein [Clostridium cibarium]
MRNMFSEYRDNSSINYTLDDRNIFSDVGYKVLRNEDTNGFIKCVKVSHNGKLKLVYDISGYRDLFTLSKEMSLDSFFTVISRLLSIVNGVKENGFMEYKNIDSSMSSIFVDINNLNVYMIYLPLSYYGDKSEETFVSELKNNIVQLMNINRNLQGQNINILRNNLLSSKPLEFVLKELNNRGRNEEISQISININPNVKKKKSPFAVFEKLFSKKKEKTSNMNMQNMNMQNRSVEEYQNNSINSINQQQGNINFQQANLNFQEGNGNFQQSNNNFNQAVEQPIMNMAPPMEPQTPMGNYINNQTSAVSEEIYDEETSLLYDKNDNGGSLVLKGINTPVPISFIVDRDEYLIGASKDLVDGFIGFNKAVSRRHCKVINRNDSYYIQDVGSSNGTFVNSRRLRRDVATKISYGDKVTIANIDFMVMEM